MTSATIKITNPTGKLGAWWHVDAFRDGVWRHGGRIHMDEFGHCQFTFDERQIWFTPDELIEIGICMKVLVVENERNT